MRKDGVMRAVVLAGLAAGGLGSAGCSSLNNTETGALVGGGTGAVVGTAIGAATGRPLLGAGLGAAAGTAGGALVGNAADKRDQRDREVQHAAAIASAQAQQQRLGVFDVIRLAQGGHDDTVIVNQIRTTGSTFQLTASDLDALKENGVSPRVIAEMQNARAVTPVTRVVREPATTTTVIYEQPMYPPVYVRPYCAPPRPAVVFVGGHRHHH